jgi:molybdate transport system substrate-binding protein
LQGLRIRTVCIAVSLGVASLGCGRGSHNGAILLNAASSTTDAVEQIRDRFTASTGYRVELNFGSSSTLATQIQAGGDVDLFLSASESWADHVSTSPRGRSRVLRRVDLLSNRLVVVVPKDSPHTVGSVDDLLDPAFEYVTVADPKSQVPAGVYAREALEALGLWNELEPKLVFGENVRAALRYVETRSAQAGLVYRSDAAASSDVRVALEIDPALHQQVRYPLLLLRHSEYHEGAAEFFDYLTGPEAAEVFREHGFTVLTGGEYAPPG